MGRRTPISAVSSGPPQPAVTEAVDNGEPQAAVDELQAQADQLPPQRDSLFRGETLQAGRAVRPSAWLMVCMIAGYAAIGAFIAAAIMPVLVALRIVHLRMDTGDDLIVAPEVPKGPRCLPEAPGTRRVRGRAEHSDDRQVDRKIDQKADRQLERLLDAVLTIGSDLDLRTVLHTIIQTAVELVDARYGAVGVLDAEGNGSTSSSPWASTRRAGRRSGACRRATGSSGS